MIKKFKKVLLGFVLLLSSKSLYSHSDFKSLADSQGYAKENQRVSCVLNSSHQPVVMPEIPAQDLKKKSGFLQESLVSIKSKGKNFWKKYHTPIFIGIAIFGVVGITYGLIMGQSYKKLENENEGLKASLNNAPAELSQYKQRVEICESKIEEYKREQSFYKDFWQSVRRKEQAVQHWGDICRKFPNIDYQRVREYAALNYFHLDIQKVAQECMQAIEHLDRQMTIINDIV
jgi:hypothetical protein